MPVQYGGGGWHQGRINDKYSNRYMVSGVRCQVVGVVCHVTVLLSAGTGQRGSGNMGRPQRRGFSRGLGSVARTSTMGLEGNLLKISKG